MDFLENFLTIENLVYALVGIPAFIGFAVLVRLARQGRSSFEERHKAMDDRILQTTNETEELNKTMRKEEQLHILAAALREALLLHSSTQSHVEEYEDKVLFHLEKHSFFITYKEKIQVLRCSQKKVYGQGYFEVFGPFSSTNPQITIQENISSVMASKVPQGKVFYSLLELELYLTEKLQRVDMQKLPPALRAKNGFLKH